MSILKVILLPFVTCLALPAQIEKSKTVEAKQGIEKQTKQTKQGAVTKGADNKGVKPATGKSTAGKSTAGKSTVGKSTAGKVKTSKKTPAEIDEEKNPIPAGADPADIAAVKSARAMLRAERRIAEQIKAGKIKGIDKMLPFEEISSWPYEDGLKGMPKQLNKLHGKKVMMTGFMLPIDEVENIKEFLLVQSLWSCCYGQPPDINGTVRVVMKGKKRIDYKFDPIKVVGTFRIKATVEDGFCVDIYQLDADDVQVIK